MSKLYNQYLRVDDDFIPVFSENSDRENPNKWKSFYAHDSFKSIILQLIDTLEKGNKAKDLPLWMYGAYGTGKTYASFVIKHLLEDDLNDIKAYCNANEMSQLYGRIAGIRNKGKILVAHRSSSSSIVGNNRLYNCIIESMKAALRSNGYSYMGGKSQYDNVINTLKDPYASFNFEKAFEKYKIKFEGYATPASVISDLESLGIDDSVDLLESIVDVAEQEHFNFSTTVSEVIDWIEDVTKGNNIYATVFIWDEFTEFFKNNQNNITGLQELAQAASRISFYPFIITHSGSQIIVDQNAKKVIEARFKIKPIDMAETTAFKLMGQAIKYESDLNDEWSKVAEGLWAQVRNATKQRLLTNSKDTTETELYKLLPIHPYAALLLKVISKEISSNQRTMFQFLSGDYSEPLAEKHNFRWFIDKHSTDVNEWNLMTADYIWDYFFTEDNVDFSDSFKAAIAQFDNFVHICEEDDNKVRVMKVALLLSAIQQKSISGRAQGQSVLLKANLSNISLAFSGTPISSMISNIMTIFVSKGVFSTIQEGDDVLYIPPVNNVDQERFDKMYEEIKRTLTFEKIVVDKNCNIIEQFLPTDYMKHRYEIFTVTVLNYKATVEEAKNLPANKIPAFYLFVANEIGQAKSNETIEKIRNTIERDVFIVDFSSTPLTENEYEKYLKSKTEEKYYTVETNQGKLAKQNADKILREWKNKLNVSSMNVFPCENGQIGTIVGAGNLRKKMKEFNSKVYGAGLEEIALNDKLFEQSGFKSTVALMAMNRIPIANNYSYLNNISIKLQGENIWNNANYMNEQPNHCVSQMKKCIQDLVNIAFDKNSMIAITEIWDVLIQPPFGLMNCTGSVFLLGFLLKEYADGTYYKYDNANTVSLNHDNLAELIFTAVKGNTKVTKEQYIVKQKPEHIEFCKITGEIFKIAKDKQNSIQDIVKNINIFLKNNEYPLWSLKDYVENEFADDDMCEELAHAIDLYCDLISGSKMAGRDTTLIAEELYSIYKKNAGIASRLEQIVCVENMKAGMTYYIASNKPDLIMIVKRLGVSEQNLLLDLNNKMSDDASYLWDIGETVNQIDNIYIDYCVVDSVNLILSENKKSLFEVSEAVQKKLGLVKMPLPMLIEVRPDLSELLIVLDKIQSRKGFEKKYAIEVLKKNANIFNSFFTNQIAEFEKIVREKLNGLSSDEIAHLYESISCPVISKMPDNYIVGLNDELNNYKKNKKINKLISLWKDKTNTPSPKEWSEINKISILSLFENEESIARSTFELINKTKAAFNEAEIDKAIDFLNSSINILLDIKMCSRYMVEVFSGEYAYIIDDVQDFQDYLVKNIGSNAYAWNDKRGLVKKCIEEYASNRYTSLFKEKVIEKIKILPADEAKKLLESLIYDKPLVGISILKM